jgi:hypothetical protein
MSNGSNSNALSDLPILAYDLGNNVKLERVRGPYGWAIRNEAGSVLGKTDDEWEWEPQPSSRDEAFYERCRYATPEEAYQRYLNYQQSNPNSLRSPPLKQK